MIGSRKPAHVAVIMDGNGRWAKRRHLPRLLGHRAGVGALERLVRSMKGSGIRYLSVYAFSTENWNRPQQEVNGLMKLFAFYAKRKIRAMAAEGLRVRFAGRRDNLSSDLQSLISWCEVETAGGAEMDLIVCFNYGGRQEIIDAVQAAQKAGCEIRTEEDMKRFLYLPDVPDPDLVIRTSGEMRLSNFLLWQCSYSEFYFTDVLWPDFTPQEFQKALSAFAERDRRYGTVV